MEIDSDQLIEIAALAIQRAKVAGMDGALVNAGLYQVFSTRFANSAIHQNYVDFKTNFMITVIKGLKKVNVSTNSLEETDISQAVKKAIKMVMFLPDDPEFPDILTDPQEYPKLQLNDPAVKNLSPADIADKIINGINAGHAFSTKVQTLSGNLNLLDGFSYFLSSEGLENLTPVTRITSTINVMTDDGHGESRSNSSFGERRFSILPFKEEAIKVAERAILGLNAQEIELKAYPVILDFQATADQMFFLCYAMSATMVIDQLSFLKDKLGEQVFADSLTVINDPYNPTAITAQPHDLEGVATQKFILINKGIIENFAHNRLTARRMDIKSNGCASYLWGEYISVPKAVKILPGQKSRQQLIEEMNNGLIITNLHYTNFIDTPRGTETGMTKDGVFVVKNGEIVGAARNMRFTENIPQMFSRAEVSREVLQVMTPYEIGFDAPAIRIGSMNFSSKAAH